jgi:autotransporter-associated beta strand protein
VDLFGYDNNRLLAGAEYVAQTNLMHPVPYTTYNNSDDVNQYWVSINGMGRLDDRPIWELIYNHYAVLEGLSAPNSQAMAQLMRPEHGSDDHFGYGTLTFTLDSTASPYPPLPVPAAPTGLTATAGASQVALNWSFSQVNAAQGYEVLRSTTSGGPYTSISSWNALTYPQYIDTAVISGSTYYYVVAAINQSGTSGYSAEASATPFATGTLPSGWTNQDIGTVETSGTATYGSGGDGTFAIQGTGEGVGGTSDGGYNFTYLNVTGNFTITTQILDTNWNSGGGEVGLMMRETLNPNASAVLIQIGDGGGAQTGYRTSTGANLDHYNGNIYAVTPTWFRMQRSGNSFTIYESSDGATWFLSGSSTQTMASSYYVGLFTFNNSTTLNSFVIDHVTSTALSPPAGVGAAAQADQVALNWEAAPFATSYNVERSTTSGSGYTTIASVSGTSAYTSTSYTDTAVTSGSTYYYVIASVSGSATSVNSPQISAIAENPAGPAPPAGLYANPGSDEVALSWQPAALATSYNVGRSLTSGNGYTTLASSVSGTNYTDSIVTGGTTYYYVVSANDSFGGGTNSVELQLITSGTTVAGFGSYAGLITLGPTADLTYNDSTGTYASSVSRAAGLAIYGGENFTTGNEPANFLVIGSAAGNTDDSFGPLALDSGAFFGRITPNTASNATLTFSSLSRNAGTQLNFGHSGNFGLGVGSAAIGTGSNNVSVVFGTAPTSLMVGGGGPAGSSTLDILPFAFVTNDLTTYDTTYGLRGLNTSAEMATLSSGMTSGQNAKIASGTVTLTGTTSINALLGSGGTISGTGTLVVTSGAIVCGVGYTIANSVLAFGAAEGEINVANVRTLTINSQITGSGGLTIGLEDYNNTTAGLVLGGSNTYTGVTTIEGNNASMLVTLTNGSAFQDTTLDYNNYGASLQFGAGASQVNSATFGGLEGAQNLALANAGTSGGGVTLTVGGDGDDTTYSGVLSGGGGIVKIGTGTLTLTGTCTYSGTTSVASGVLSVIGSLASPVSVATGGTLAGAGSVGGAASVASGGTLAPAGTFTFNGSLGLNGGSTLALALSSTTTQVAVNGSYSGPATGVVTVNVSSIGSPGTYSLITGASGISAGSFQLGTAPAGNTYALTATNGTLSLVVSVPPAPTGLTASGGTGEVALSWNPSSGATNYDVQRTLTSGSGYTFMASVSGTSYTDTSVSNGTTYYYVVAASNNDGEGANSAQVSAIPSVAIGGPETLTPEMVMSGSGANTNLAFTVQSSVVGHTYQVQFSGNLASGSWTNVGSAQAGTGGNITVNVTVNASSVQCGFYRILIQQ